MVYSFIPGFLFGALLIYSFLVKLAQLQPKDQRLRKPKMTIEQLDNIEAMGGESRAEQNGAPALVEL